MTKEQDVIIRKLVAATNADPQFGKTCVDVVMAVLSNNVRDARKERCEWETIAISAMETRLFKSQKKTLSQRIRKMSKTNSLNWEPFLEKIEK